MPPLSVPWPLVRAVTTRAERLEAAACLERAADRFTPPAIVAGLAAHGLVPLAYRHLVSAGDVGLPAPLAGEIRSEFQRHALTRFRYARRLRELLDALQQAGIQAVPYKGPALAIQLFGHFAMRQFGDLDILVRPADARRATEALLAAGLVRHRRVPDGWEDYLIRVRHSIELRDPAVNVVIELHWSVADRFLGMDLDVDWLLEDTTCIDLLGRPTPAFQGERLLLALALHGARHLWERAAWLGEAAELIRASSAGIDWAAVFARADRSGLGRIVRAMLILVRDRLDVQPPAPWDRQPEADLGAVRLAGMLLPRLGGAPSDRLVASFRLGLRAQTTLRRRALFCWRVATDLSDRDLRRFEAPPRFPIVHGLARSRRLARLARAERGAP